MARSEDFLFSPRPMTDEQIEKLARIEERVRITRRTGAWKHLAELRQEIGDPFGSLEVTVLRPMCSYCFGRLTGNDWDRSYLKDHQRKIIVLYPTEVDGCGRLYDPRGKQVHIFDSESKPFSYRTPCLLCRDRVEISANDYVFVVPEPYTSYFELPDTGPRNAPQWLRKKLLEWYGSKCFMCVAPLNKKNMTVDHIRPKSAQGSLDFSNLQPLCERCNSARKRNEEGPLTRST